MKQYFIETYGCQMNVADSEVIAGIMEREGYSRAKQLDDAHAILINTCAIREHAEDKVHSRLGILKNLKKKNPDLLLGLMGCMAQHVKEDILENKPYVDFVLGPDSYRRLPEILNRHKQSSQSIVDTKLSKFEVYDKLFPSRSNGVNAWVSIMRGCDKFCTFCIVPFTRGRERSRSIASVIEEVKRAVEKGFPEVTLLGQNVNSYTHNTKRFPDLLDDVAAVPGVKRVRFISPHPQDVDDQMLLVMRDHANLCKSIHLPLQAGSDRILKRMNRTYSRDEFLALVGRIRNILPGCGLTTDIIVGFPGETQTDFEETLAVMEEVKFDSAFTFKYSPRPGTKAYGYEAVVPEEEKQARLNKLLATQKRHTLFRNSLEVGKTVDVLVERESKKSSEKWAGRTDNNKWVVFSKDDAKVGEIIEVTINKTKGITLFGERVKNRENADAIA
ncbi:MAG: tRNA (N6-isopentenyl adenosine(37)-C2)-methylthiotransferase MiaB [Candidatus Marinimicrobia bacterium]|jgi:tRNA-2-methylthio-N6-dimethylallyladenosine synthase|nr:tRNA (N6-isopentenyl adenosine(37)-C2)-methylthiotransferase MiaB [Candidatus Neomarinimicrobiota bacterium]